MQFNDQNRIWPIQNLSSLTIFCWFRIWNQIFKKKSKKISKTKKHDFCSVYSGRNFVPNQKKTIFFEFSIIELTRKNSFE